MSAGVAFERISCGGNVKCVRGMQTKRTQCKKALSHGNQWQMCWQKAGGVGVGGRSHTHLSGDRLQWAASELFCHFPKKANIWRLLQATAAASEEQKKKCESLMELSNKFR